VRVRIGIHTGRPTLTDSGYVGRMVKTLPRARLVEIPRAVHTLHEDNPEAVLDALRRFLDF
jgi:pimeloyl-ACP methyl ester carboxylesterase